MGCSDWIFLASHVHFDQKNYRRGQTGQTGVVMVNLHGLTPIQVHLCDQIWNLDTTEQLTSWFNSLPDTLVHDACCMMNMIVVELLDQTIDLDLTEANQVISQIKQNI